MDDLAKTLTDLLGTEEGQKNLQSIASMLGLGGDSGGPGSGAAHSPQQPSPDLSALGGILSSLGSGPGGAGPQQTQQDSGSGFNLDPAMLIKIQQLMSRMQPGADDKNIALLRALKPHISRENKVDEAIRILQLLSVLPSLGEIGLFGGDMF